MARRARTVVAAWIVAVGVLAGGAGGQATSRPETPVNVGFLVLDGVYNSELIAPVDIFHHTVFHTKPGMRVFTVGRSMEPVRTFEGLRIAVDHDLETAPPIDVLVVPSAAHSMDTDLDDERLIAWVRERGGAADYVLSVCDGAFVLAEAGLLEGRFCTTFPSDVAALRKRYAGLHTVEGVTFVADGKAITGVGGARSYEPALHLVEHLYGAKVAAGVARGMALTWDLEKERHLIMPASPATRPACWMPGERVDPSVTVEDADGVAHSLADLVAEAGDVRAVVLTIMAGGDASGTRQRGGLWCEDTYNEVPNLRHLKLRYEAEGVLFVTVCCPPIHHEAQFGYDAGSFLGSPGGPAYRANRAKFVQATRAVQAGDGLPFHSVAYDPRFRLLKRAPDADDPPWAGRFRWFAETQTYGTPTTWVLTRDLEVLGPPFIMNVYESDGRKLRYTVDDVATMIDVCLNR